MAAPRTLFVSLTDDIGTDRIVADLGRAGAACAVLGPLGSFASQVRCVEARFTLPRWARGPLALFATSRLLAQAVAAWHPNRVVPLDDLSATLLRTLARKAPGSQVGRVLVASLGEPVGYKAACGRVALMAVAAGAGVRVPRFAASDGSSGIALRDLAGPVMVKRDQSSGSGGVTRVDEPRRLARTIRLAQLKGAAKRHLARIAGFGRPDTPILVQSVVDGRLAMFTAVAENGRMIDGAGFEAVETHPTKGSSTILRHCDLPEMADAARTLIAVLGCSGFVSFDFILDDARRAFLIEMNPRPIGSAHLGRRFGHDLARAFLTGTRSHGPHAAEPPIDIALFPKELERDPSGSRLSQPGIGHDLPQHEPAVVGAYLRRLQAEHPAYAATLAARCGMTNDADRDRQPHPEFELC